MSAQDKLSTLAERLYATRAADLLGYLRRRSRNDADARDIVQEAFFRFLRLDDPQRLMNPEAYLFRIAGNLLWERELHRQRESGSDALDDMAAADSAPFDLAAADEATVRVRAVIDSLPTTQRAVVILRLREQMSFAEIATHAGISQTMARKHFSNALTTCRKRLRDFKPERGEG